MLLGEGTLGEQGLAVPVVRLCAALVCGCAWRLLVGARALHIQIPGAPPTCCSQGQLLAAAWQVGARGTRCCGGGSPLTCSHHRKPATPASRCGGGTAALGSTGQHPVSTCLWRFSPQLLLGSAQGIAPFPLLLTCRINLESGVQDLPTPPPHPYPPPCPPLCSSAHPELKRLCFQAVTKGLAGLLAGLPAGDPRWTGEAAFSRVDGQLTAWLDSMYRWLGGWGAVCRKKGCV